MSKKTAPMTLSPAQLDPQLWALEHPRAGQMVFFGAHGGARGEVTSVPALLCRMLPKVEGEPQKADLYIYNSLQGQCGFAYNVIATEKLRVGSWSTTEEYEVATPAPVETRPPGERIDAPAANQLATNTGEEPDPQLEGTPNVFGGLTKYNAAIDRWQHSNEHDELLWICPDDSCQKPHWMKRGSKIPESLGCCTDNMRRRQLGKQSEPVWVERGLWRIPSSAPVGTEDTAGDDGRGPGE